LPQFLTYQNTKRRHNLEDLDLNLHDRENLKSRNLIQKIIYIFLVEERLVHSNTVKIMRCLQNTLYSFLRSFCDEKFINFLPDLYTIIFFVFWFSDSIHLLLHHLMLAIEGCIQRFPD
jgi:hypothetical protein